MAWLVYKHTSPNGKVYIGITHQKPEYRWRNGDGYRTNTRFYRAICKYGWGNFQHEIIADNLSEEEATRCEVELIGRLKSADKRYGYNVALGGHVLSEDSRRKIGETRRQKGIPSPTKGKQLSAETRAKISRAHIGKHYSMSEEGKENIRISKLGEKNPNYGKKIPVEVIAKRVEKLERPVVKINGNERIVYRSLRTAEKQTGVCSDNISRVCRGRRATAGGFKWEYAQL